MNIFSLTTNKLVEHLKTGQISSVEVCTQYIERIEKFEKDINAWEYFDKKKLLEKAEEADEHRKSGKPLGASSGILGIDFGDEYYSSNKFLTYQFKKAGKYTVSVSQNMRGQQELNGVMLVGVKISPSNK